MLIRNHLLYLGNDKPADFVATRNMGGEIRPIYIVIHYTAGETAAGAIDWFERPEAKASAHIVIDRDGTVTQMVPFNRRAWHAGESRWGELTGLNAYSIGIEIANAGKLTRQANGRWLTWSKKTIEDSHVSIATHKNELRETGWHEYEDAQIAAVIDVGMAIAQKYEIVDVLGHDDIAPNRKVDPGPLFPMSSVRSRILGREH
jgi:N-acetylmuramoyl-L-alanine amidase